MSFAFVCQHNSFIIFNSLQSPTFGSWKTVAQRSMTTAFALCAAFGIAGYLSFRSTVDGDVLNNFSNMGKEYMFTDMFMCEVNVYKRGRHVHGEIYFVFVHGVDLPTRAICRETLSLVYGPTDYPRDEAVG